MKNILLLTILATLFISCSKNDNEISNPIVGEWKLMKSEHYRALNSKSTTDYSSQNIIYKFDSNSNLNVNNSNNGYNAGNYKYEFKNDYLSGSPSSTETKIFMVVINSTKWTYNQSNGTLVLGNSYVDGLDLYFEKK